MGEIPRARWGSRQMQKIKTFMKIPLAAPEELGVTSCAYAKV